MDEQAKLFLQFDYAETKDLCMHFLTLIAAVLVFSIAFSEKIIDFPRAKTSARNLLLMSWGLFMFAIIGCGIGLVYIFDAAALATHNPGANYWQSAMIAYVALSVAGTAFVIGLVTLVSTAVISIYQR